jgi:hypothetical protein
MRSVQGKGGKNGMRLGVCVMVLLIAQNTASSRAWENWNDMSCALKLNAKTSLEIYNRTKFRKTPLREAYLTGIQGGFSRKIDAGLATLAAYRYETNNKKKYYEFENRFLLQFSYKRQIEGKFELLLTQRTELRFFTAGTHDNVRLRASSGVSRKLAIHGRSLAPYVTGELFYDTNAHQINRERIYGGMLFALGGNSALKLGWVGQFDEGTGRLDILNSGLNLSF